MTNKLLFLVLFFIPFHVLFARDQKEGMDKKAQQARELIFVGKATHRPLIQAEGYFRLGKIADGVGEFAKAKSYFHKARLIYLQCESQPELARVLNRLSSIEYKLKNWKESIDLIEQSLEAAQACQDDRLICMAYISRSLGKTEWAILNQDTVGLFKRTLEDYEFANERATQVNDPVLINDIYIVFAGIFSSLGHPDRALALYQKAHPYYKQLDFTQPKLIFYLNMAATFIALDQPIQAFPLIQDVSHVVEKSSYQDFSPKIRYHEVAAAYFTHTQEYEKAMAHMQKWKSIWEEKVTSESILVNAQTNQSHQMQAKNVELAQTKATVVYERSLRKWQQILTWISVIFTLVLGGLVFYLVKLYRTYRRVSQQNEILVQEQSHRVKNNLQMVSSLLNMQAYMSGEQRMIDMIQEVKLRLDSMIMLHKQLYREDASNTIHLHDLVVNLVESAAFSFGIINLTYTLDPWDDSIELDQSILVILIINELLTNACKYAFPGLEQPRILISLTKELNDAKLIIQDNGVNEFEGNTFLAGDTSFGFRMINMLLTQLGGIIRYSYTNGSRFTIILPIDGKK